MSNLIIFTEFILMDISSSRELQVVQVLLFLVIYLGALTQNLLTITVIVIDPRLHSQMYFFIGNLSLIDLCFISVIVPKLIMNSLANNKSISLTACAAQIFLFNFFGSTELAFLVVMSYDCYVTICHPLHYGLTLTPRLCPHAAGGSWPSGLVNSAIHTGNMFRLPFTDSYVIHQYFCDVPEIVRLSYSDVQFSESIILAISLGMGLISFALLFMSYINIFSIVLSMHSVEACNKSLTCTPQLAIILIFTISGFIAIIGPIADKASLKNLFSAMFYTMVPPVINPLTYSLCNREINTVIRRMFNIYFEFLSRVFHKKKYLITKLERSLLFI